MELKRFLGKFAKTYLAIGALSFSAFAGADDFHNNYGPGCAPGYNPPCAPPNSCCGVPCNDPPACSWGYNPPAYARCGCDTACNGFLDSFAGRIDFLWWRANEDGLQLGTEEFVETFTTASGDSNVINRSRSKKPNFRYDPGFRLGLISYCGCDNWDVAFNWTHFHTKANVTGETLPTVGTSTTTFYSDWERLTDVNPLLSKGRYTLNLDLLDLEFGRKFYVSSCFVLRPHFGLRGSRIDQNYRVFSEANVLVSTAPFSDFQSTVKSRSDFLAIGPRVGLDIEVQLGCGLSLFGQAAGSIVFGKFDDHSKEFYTDFSTSTGPFVSAFEYEAKSSTYRNSRTFTDLAIGVKWDHCFDWCNRLHPVSIAFAWEHHGFYNMNNFNFVERGFDLDTTTGIATGTNRRKHGDLFTQGLTVSASFGF